VDIATLVGWVSGFILVVLGAAFSGLNPLKLVDISSIFITFGGGIFAQHGRQ